MVDGFLSFDATKQRHLADANHPERYAPDNWTDAVAHLAQPGQHSSQAALLYDYA